ncbi:hypothetical protein PMIN07_001452 [Paraphaeosphaeria minitans]
MEKGSDVFGILVQDYIIGKECSVIVLEMGFEVVALTPLQYIFPEDTPAEKEFLTWENKFEAVDKGIIKYAFVENEHTAALQQCAVDAFKAIGVTGSGSWARVDLRLEEATGHVYAIEVNCIPVVFYPHGNTLGDDLVVSEKFPGAQPACFDMMLATKQMQLGWHNARVLVVAKVYNDFALTYDAVTAKIASGLRALMNEVIDRFDMSGSILDVACGTGALAACSSRRLVAILMLVSKT